jgi:hypothetical protein
MGLKSGNTVTVTICRGETYRFNNQDLSEAGIYRSTRLDSNDSVIWLRLAVNDPPVLQINFNRDIQYCLGSKVNLEAAGADAITWWSGAEPLGKGKMIAVELSRKLQTIEIKGTAGNGCMGKAAVTVEAETCCVPGLPNTIKPDDAGETTAFGPENTDQVSNYDMWIYNSTGQEVYEVAHSKTKWNGICEDGKPAAAGVYFYAVKGYCSNGKPFQARGRFMLIR